MGEARLNLSAVRRRFIRFTAALVFAALMLSACGPASSTPTSTQVPPTSTKTPSPTKTVTSTRPVPIGIAPGALKGTLIQVWHAFAGSAYDVFTRQVNQFNASNEWGIWVDPTGYGDYSNLFDSVDSALLSGDPPDLVASLPEQTLAWTASNAVVDLAPYLADSTWGMDSEALADIPSSFLAQDNPHGSQWGLPAERSGRFLFYNATWAQDLGFDSPPATPDEFRRQACAANASFRRDSDLTNDSYGGWIIDTDWQTSYSWLLAFDGGVTDGAAYAFRTDPNRTALQFLKLLYQDHCAWLPQEPASFNPFDSFAGRLALFVSADLSEIPQATASMGSRKNTDRWELIPFPGQQKQVLVDYGPSFSVLKSTPEKQLAAYVFIRWLLSPDNQAQWVQATGLFPLRLASLSHLSAFKAASPQWEGAVVSVDLAQNGPALASWRKVRYVLQDGLTTIFQTNVPLAQLPSVLTEMDSMAQELNK